MAQYALQDAIRDANGCTGYTEDKAALGTVPIGYYLQLPQGVNVANDRNTRTPIFANAQQRQDFVQINYEALVNAGVRESDALFCTMIRYSMCQHGFLARTANSRCVYVDEVVQNVPVPQNPRQINLNPEMIQFVGDYWDNMAANVAHVFRVRGHHWKDELAELYRRTWAAAIIEAPQNVNMPDWGTIARAGFHCFGVALLEDVVTWSQTNHRLSRSFQLRRDAAPAGTAPIRTTAAALREMSSSLWYDAFAHRFQNAIIALQAEEQRLIAAGLSGHVNAGLYGLQGIAPKPDETVVQPLAPYVLGWIDNLDQNEPICRQRSINKRAQGGSALRQAFGRVIANEIRTQGQYQSVAAFLAQQAN